MAKYLDEGGVRTLWGKIKSLFYKKSEVDSKLDQKMNNGIIQTHRGQEVSFKTSNNVDNVVFNYRSEQSQPITRFEFHAGQADGTKADIVCRHIDCWNIDAASQLKFNGNEANIFLKNAQAEYPLITLKASTTEPYGHGVLIGGGGSVVIGAGESANTVFNNVVPNPGDESVRISADEIICFYPGQQNGFSDKNTYINTNGEYIMNNKKVATEEWVKNNVSSSGGTIKTYLHTYFLKYRTSPRSNNYGVCFQIVLNTPTPYKTLAELNWMDLGQDVEFYTMATGLYSIDGVIDNVCMIGLDNYNQVGWCIETATGKFEERIDLTQKFTHLTYNVDIFGVQDN